MHNSKKDKKEVPVTFQLKGIELLDFCFNYPKTQIQEQVLFNFDLKLEHKINQENKFIAVVISIEILNESRETKLGSMMVSCIYEIANIEDFINSKTTIVELPEVFITTVNSLTISTARGVMFALFKGTFLHNAVLPVIDPNSFVTQK